jgi:hypothetical protein
MAIDNRTVFDSIGDYSDWFPYPRLGDYKYVERVLLSKEVGKLDTAFCFSETTKGYEYWWKRYAGEELMTSEDWKAITWYYLKLKELKGET